MAESSTLLSIVRMAEGCCHKCHLERFSRVDLKKFSFQGGEEENSNEWNLVLEREINK